VLLAVAGSLILMAGVLLGVVSAILGQAPPGERFPAFVISAGLISAGLFCGCWWWSSACRTATATARLGPGAVRLMTSDRTP